MKYSYRDADNVAQEREDTFREELGIVASDGEWHWKCLNLLDIMSTVVGNLATSQRVITLRFTKDDQEEDYWVDNFMVSRTVTDAENIDAWVSQRVESLSPKTDTVSVTQNGNKLTVVFNPINCANDYDLISFVGMDATTGGNNNKLYVSKLCVFYLVKPIVIIFTNSSYKQFTITNFLSSRSSGQKITQNVNCSQFDHHCLSLLRP